MNNDTLIIYRNWPEHIVPAECKYFAAPCLLLIWTTRRELSVAADTISLVNFAYVTVVGQSEAEKSDAKN